jgi:FKBP-type peptidyl-prolyl cis-trans isomerase SlyD
MGLADAHGAELSPPSELSYLHGGYGEMLAALEQALEGKGAGESVHLQLEPQQAFGQYDPELLRTEPLGRYGEGVSVGMQIEEDGRRYTVTDIAGGSVMLDANHPPADPQAVEGLGDQRESVGIEGAETLVDEQAVEVHRADGSLNLIAELQG